MKYTNQNSQIIQLASKKMFSLKKNRYRIEKIKDPFVSKAKSSTESPGRNFCQSCLSWCVLLDKFWKERHLGQKQLKQYLKAATRGIL